MAKKLISRIRKSAFSNEDLTNEENTDIYNDKQNTLWIINNLKYIKKEQQCEWLAYRIFYNDYNPDMQDYPFIILLNTTKQLIKDNLSNKQLFEYYISDENNTNLYDILNTRIDMRLQRYIWPVYNQYIQYFLYKKDKDFNSYNFCIKIKEYIYEIIGDQIYNILSFGFKKPQIATEKAKERNTVSAASQVLQLIKQALEKHSITENIINIFTNPITTKALTGLRFPMLYTINENLPLKYQGIINNKKRYNVNPIQILNKQYLLINEIYEKNVEQIKNIFQQLKLI